MFLSTVNVCEHDCWKYNCRCNDSAPIHSENHYHSVINELISKMPKDFLENCIEQIEKKRKRDSEWHLGSDHYIWFFPTNNTDLWKELGWEKKEYSESIFDYYVRKLYEKFYSEEMT